MSRLEIITRFAPAPTGFLHLGHVVNAIYVWGIARGAGGRVVLRVEDHDRTRSRAEYEDAILEDLEWLGFSADQGPVRQRERGALYESALERLRAQGLVYACDCSRSEIAAASQPARELRYPGTCRDKHLPERPGLGVRVRLEPSVERFHDLRHGAQEQRPLEESGDLLARDRDGNWTYQFAVTVDDQAQDITLVIRGDDLLPSTGRQIQLARLLGRETPPRFLHHPLVMKSAIQKLSKADRDTSVRDLRSAGWTAARVVGRAAASVGLIDGERPLGSNEIVALFPQGPGQPRAAGPESRLGESKRAERPALHSAKRA
jgi:glutamyl-tRNA synthetase/glutamyl-Q tRNA(Asp) synthetase